MKTLLAIALLCLATAARAGWFGSDKPKESIAALAPAALDLASALNLTPAQRSILAIAKGVAGQPETSAPVGHPNAITNYFERYPDGTTRLITNAIIPLLTFPSIELPPIATPPAKPTVPPVAPTLPAAPAPAATNTPAGGTLLDEATK